MLSRPLNPAALAGPDGTYRAAQEITVQPGHGTATPSGWRRTARAVSFGLIALDGAATAQRERRLLSDLQARQRQPRMVAFVSSKGGVGVSATAAGVALTLATIRRDRTVLVDVRTGTESLGRRLVGRSAPSVAELTGSGSQPLATPLPATAHLDLVDGAPWHAPLGRGELLNLLEDLRDGYPFTVLDAGNDTGDATHAAVGRADQIVLVTSANADAVDATRLALGRIYQTHPMSLARLLIAIVCLSPRSYRHTARALRRTLGARPASLLPVPYDRRLARGERLQLDALQPATREAYLAIAASIATPPSHRAVEPIPGSS
jgi:MinD-like ATPase involved in chromosome partitioning or flagellar assembly